MKRIYGDVFVNESTADKPRDIANFKLAPHYEQEMRLPSEGGKPPHLPPKPSSRTENDHPYEHLPSFSNLQTQNQANAGNVRPTAPASFSLDENSQTKLSPALRSTRNRWILLAAAAIGLTALAGLCMAAASFVKSSSSDDELNQMKQENVEQRIQIERIQNAVFSPIPTCDHITSNRESGFFHLSPAGPDQLAAEFYCNFTGIEAETIIYHNFPNEVDAGDCEAIRCAHFKVVYDVSMPQIIALIEQSAECRQFIKYRCIHSLLLRGDINTGITVGTWLSRDGTPQIYWGGATLRLNYYCACGETNSCVDPDHVCNCDANSFNETSDEGFLTFKPQLPVTELQFGDLSTFEGQDERGWFTLGPLICSGRADQTN